MYASSPRNDSFLSDLKCEDNFHRTHSPLTTREQPFFFDVVSVRRFEQQSYCNCVRKRNNPLKKKTAYQ